MTQPEALRLADVLEATDQMHTNADLTSVEVATELRRLHEVNRELLAALKALVAADAPDYIKSSIWNQARAAIDKGELK